MKKNKNDDPARNVDYILPYLDFGRGSLDSKMYILDIYYTLYSIFRNGLFLCFKCTKKSKQKDGVIP